MLKTELDEWFGQNLEDQNADRNAENKENKKQTQDVALGNNDPVGIWNKHHVCYTMVENLHASAHVLRLLSMTLRVIE